MNALPTADDNVHIWGGIFTADTADSGNPLLEWSDGGRRAWTEATNGVVATVSTERGTANACKGEWQVKWSEFRIRSVPLRHCADAWAVPDA